MDDQKPNLRMKRFLFVNRCSTNPCFNLFGYLQQNMFNYVSEHKKKNESLENLLVSCTITEEILKVCHPISPFIIFTSKLITKENGINLKNETA